MTQIFTEPSDIDFVILWVDGADPEWRKSFLEHEQGGVGDQRACRYRNWDNLHFIFRGIELFAPWVRKIHFVTWGHLPLWLNKKHEKLHIVNHNEFLDHKNLPVFNCNPIEVNLHRINGLSEKFVYFNDDTFLLRPLANNYFFKDGLPKDMFVFNAIFLDSISHIRLNDIKIVDKFFTKREVIRNNIFKIFNYKYGIHQLRSLFLLPWPQMTGFYDPHQPQPFLKKTFEDVWCHVNDILAKTSASRFRCNEDVNHYLFRYWQLLEGNFYPRSFSDTNTLPIRLANDIDAVVEAIKLKKYTMLCINDELEGLDYTLFDKYKDSINRAFDTILPDKCTFEL